jgi:hypothetical protein
MVCLLAPIIARQVTGIRVEKFCDFLLKILIVFESCYTMTGML